MANHHDQNLSYWIASLSAKLAPHRLIKDKRPAQSEYIFMSPMRFPPNQECQQNSGANARIDKHPGDICLSHSHRNDIPRIQITSPQKKKWIQLVSLITFEISKKWSHIPTANVNFQKMHSVCCFRQKLNCTGPKAPIRIPPNN
jgi:hypothetical protein